jgi:branched-chain amino acid transport system substrate-binding protein
MKKQIWIPILVVVIIVVGVILLTNQKQTPLEGEIEIGVITPLTGPASTYGIATQKSLNLAANQINDNGGINNSKIKLIYEDSKCDPKTGVTSLKKFNSIDNIPIVVGTICSSVTLAMGPIVQENNSLIISSGASNPKIADYSNIFRTWPSDTLQGKILAKFVKQSLHLDEVAIIYINNDYGVGVKDVFKKHFIEQGGKILIEESVPESVIDAKTQITKIKSKNPKGVFIATYGKEMGTILKQAKELGLSSQFFGGDVVGDDSVINLSSGGAEGLMASASSINDNKKRTSFLNSFKEEFGENPGVTGDAAFDILFLLKNVIEDGKCDFTDVTCIKNKLQKINNFEGVTGEISFDQNGDLLDKKYDFFQVKNGQFVPYEE